MRRTSAVFRPVLAGYERTVRMVFFGSIIKTLRMVKAMPFSSTFVASWWSILSQVYQHPASSHPDRKDGLSPTCRT